MKKIIDPLIDRLSDVIVGKQQTVRLAVCCLLARGHLLLEDLPGMGKTTLSQSLASVLGLNHKRVQFTSDLLPADLIGGMVYEQNAGQFTFHPGPIFCQVLLADELNRATPKAQSALLQAMEEAQVSVDGQPHPLPEPFFVIATQNPTHQSGTYPLPESQLDRFLMRLSLGYPDEKTERALLKGEHGRQALSQVKALYNPTQLQTLQQKVPALFLSESVLDYVQRLIAASRDKQICSLGLSPRAAQFLVRAAQAWALMVGRDHVLPEDIQAVFLPVCAHRIQGRDCSGETAAQQIITRINVV